MALIDIKVACAATGRLTRVVQRLARSLSMLDVIMLAIAFVFFALSIAYVYACDQL
jgi:hypothetical protein